MDLQQQKVVILGDTSVGKTSLLQRYIGNNFSDTLTSTIGASFQQKTIQTQSGKEITLQLWDTAGQERYANLAALYYRSCQAVLICFDASCQSTLQRAQWWLNQMKTEIDINQVVVVLVANKIDLLDDETLAQLNIQLTEYIQNNNIQHYYMCSAKLNLNLNEIFVGLAELLLIKVNEQQYQKEVDLKLLKKSASKQAIGCCK